MHRLNILFLGGAKRVAVARLLKEAGKRRGVEVNIFGYELDRRVPLAVEGEIIEGRRWSDHLLFDSLRKAVKDHRIDIILPFVDGAIEIASRFVMESDGVFCPVSVPEVAKVFFDKCLSAEAFENAGLPIPETMSFPPAAFPVIAKPRFGSASKGIIVINDEADLRSASINPADYLLQRYIRNRTEITADGYVGADGTILAISPRIRLETAGGEAVRTVTIDDPEAVELATAAINRLNLRGAVTIQFIRDNDSGRLLVMEINPRLGGGVVASVHAGADILSLIIDEALGNQLKRLYATPGVLVARYLQEVVFYESDR